MNASKHPKVYETQETTMQPAASGLHITGGILHLGVDVWWETLLATEHVGGSQCTCPNLISNGNNPLCNLPFKLLSRLQISFLPSETSLWNTTRKTLQQGPRCSVAFALQLFQNLKCSFQWNAGSCLAPRWIKTKKKLRNDMISCHDCCRIDWLLDFFCKFYEVWKSFEAGSFAVQKKARAVNPTKTSSSMCLHMYRACILQCNAINKDMHIIQRSQPLYRPHMSWVERVKQLPMSYDCLTRMLTHPLRRYMFGLRGGLFWHGLTRSLRGNILYFLHLSA